VAIFGERDARPSGSVETEFERVRAIRRAAEEELGRLRRELADALAQIAQRGGRLPAGAEGAFEHAQIGLAARAQELNRREEELAARERAIVQEEAELARRAGDADAQRRLREVEARLVQLQEAEKAFARSQAELAAYSDDLARREAELLERRRAGAKSAGHDLDRAALDELDERLRRLERETREAGESTFDGGLRTLAEKGVRSSPPNA